MQLIHQNLLLQFFSNMECDCAADNSRSMQIFYIFRCLHPTWTRCAAAFASSASPIVHGKPHVQRSNFSSHTSQPPANDIYVKFTFWWHILFSTIVPSLYSKGDFRLQWILDSAHKTLQKHDFFVKEYAAAGLRYLYKNFFLSSDIFFS